MSGGIAGRGRPGPAGPAGPMGPTGPKGDAAFTLAIGDVTALPYGQEPSVTNVGTPLDQVWDLALVTGATGVLTGATPPTGADGTSLGQLYFCTTNQMYYGLIELRENDNKWRPIMTQESSIRTYHLDLLMAQPRDYAGTAEVAGAVTVRFDDVKQQVTASVYLHKFLPIREGTSWAYDWSVFLDLEEQRALVADALAQGVTAIPMPGITVVNQATTDFTFDPLGSYSTATIAALNNIIPPQAGTGSDPGWHYIWDEGQLVTEKNDTGAPGASTYGNAGSGPMAHGLCIVNGRFSPDAEYSVEIRLSTRVVVNYA